MVQPNPLDRAEALLYIYFSVVFDSKGVTNMTDERSPNVGWQFVLAESVDQLRRRLRDRDREAYDCGEKAGYERAKRKIEEVASRKRQQQAAKSEKALRDEIYRSLTQIRKIPNFTQSKESSKKKELETEYQRMKDAAMELARRRIEILDSSLITLLLIDQIHIPRGEGSQSS
jgi:hypothetical protein